MTGSQRTSTRESRRLTTAGLIAITAATLLMMAWAILPTSAFADPSFPWGHNGFPNDTCGANPATMLWIFNDNGTAVPTSLTINGQVQSGSWSPHQFTVTVNGSNYPPTSASVTYTGTLGNSTVLTLSHCSGTGTTTTTTTTTVPTTTTTVPTTTTTTASPTVAPTTVTPTTTPRTTTRAPTVAPTTVSPGGTAFTGAENVVPIGAIALMLMTSGSGLLWAGSRRKRDQDQDEE